MSSQNRPDDMHETISFPGLKFELFELQGLLTYTLTRSGKTPKVYKIHADDFETDDDDGSDGSCQEAPRSSTRGISASAVGLQLRLVKNDGILSMEYETDDGTAAQWTFDGLALLDGGTMLAAAATQTDTDPNKCFVCGQDKKKTLEMKHQEVQTDAIVTRSIDTQTVEFTFHSTAVQATPKSLPFHHHIQRLSRFSDPSSTFQRLKA
jgi:hypothetical protein